MKKILLLIAAILSLALPAFGQYTVPTYSAVYLGKPTSGTPTFSPGTGSYGSTQSVTISATGGSVICYNTTGSPATNGTTGCTTGTLYSGAVSVSTSETLYAVSGGTGYTDSSVGSATYTISASPGYVSGSLAQNYCTSGLGVGAFSCPVSATIHGGSNFVAAAATEDAASPHCLLTSVTSPHMTWAASPNVTLPLFSSLWGGIYLGTVNSGYTGAETITLTYTQDGSANCAPKFQTAEFVPTGTSTADKTQTNSGYSFGQTNNTGTTATLAHASEIGVSLLYVECGVNPATSSPSVQIGLINTGYSAVISWVLTSSTTGISTVWTTDTYCGNPQFTAGIVTVY